MLWVGHTHDSGDAFPVGAGNTQSNQTAAANTQQVCDICCRRANATCTVKPNEFGLDLWSQHAYASFSQNQIFVNWDVFGRTLVNLNNSERQKLGNAKEQ